MDTTLLEYLRAGNKRATGPLV